MKKRKTPVRERSHKRKTTHHGVPFFQFAVSVLVLIISILLMIDPHPSTGIASIKPQKTYAEESLLISSTSAQFFTTPLIDSLPTPTSVPANAPTPPIQIIPTAPANGYCLSIPIVLYHHTEPISEASEQGHAQLTVDSVIFESQMKYLSENGYTSLSLDELVSALLNHTPVPAKSVAVTIDDGYLDNYTYGFQIMKKYGIKGNFMIPTGLIMNPGYMTWDNVRDIKNNGGYIYNHTWSHAALGGMGKEQIIAELTMSQNQFQQEIGQKPTIFTYPYGSFSPTAVQTLKEQGFIAGFTTISGRTQCDSNIMTLYREHIGNAPMSAYGF